MPMGLFWMYDSGIQCIQSAYSGQLEYCKEGLESGIHMRLNFDLSLGRLQPENKRKTELFRIGRQW